jgi:methylamine---glutamate N-methyltransferase subunit B
VAQVSESVAIDAAELSTRDVNRAIRSALAGGAQEVHVRDPAGRHSMGVALDGDAKVVFEGSTGWYTAGMIKRVHVVIDGNTGWGLGECMMSGRIEVQGHAGSGTAASIRGGLVYVAGDTAARAGIAMKGGTLVVGGNVGYMSGFMMQKGTLVICGDAADGLGDSMYEGTIFVGGAIASRGADAEIEETTDQDRAMLREVLVQFDLEADAYDFTKVRSGRKLWNFSTKEPELWKTAL